MTAVFHCEVKSAGVLTNSTYHLPSLKMFFADDPDQILPTDDYNSRENDLITVGSLIHIT